MSEGLQIPDAMLAVIEQALNRYIALDPEGATAFATLEGHIIGLELKGFGTRVTLIPGARGLQLFGRYDAEPDCLIRGTPLALLRMSLAEHKETQVMQGEVEISGDTGLAQSFNRAIAGLNVDWEEQLARVLGDPFAHQIGNQARAAANWGRKASETLTADLQEYLQEEARLLPTRYEIEAHLAQIDILRDDVERAEARIERLSRQLAQAPGSAASGRKGASRGAAPRANVQGQDASDKRPTEGTAGKGARGGASAKQRASTTRRAPESDQDS